VSVLGGAVGTILGKTDLEFGDPGRGGLGQIEAAGPGFQDQTVIAGAETIVHPDDESTEGNEDR